MNDAYEPAVLAATFDRTLAALGVDAGTRRAEAFARTVARFTPCSAEELYWLARISLLPSIADLAAFDAAFAEIGGPARPDDALESGSCQKPFPRAAGGSATRRFLLAMQAND